MRGSVTLHLPRCILDIPAEGESPAETHLQLLVEFAAVSVQHGQVQRSKVCVEAAETQRTLGLKHAGLLGLPPP